MQKANSLSFDESLITKLQTTESVNEEELRDLAIELTVRPDTAKFWLLSRLITLSTEKTLIDNEKEVVSVLTKFCNENLGAAFATAHFVHKMYEKLPETCSKLVDDLKIPINPLHSAPIINLLAVSGVSISFFERLLGFSDLSVQQSVSTAIARTCKDPRELLIARLANIESESDFNKKRGLLVLCRALCDNEVPAEAYAPVFKQIEVRGETSVEKSCCYHAQLLAADLLQHNPVAFHCFDLVPGCVTQYESQNMAPEYLTALLDAFGCSAANRLAQPILSVALEDCAIKGKKVIEIFIPFVVFLEEKAMQTFFEKLVGSCLDHRFDQSLLEITARAFASVSPVVPNTFGVFMKIVKQSPRATHFYSILRPLLEPKCPPPPQKLSGITLVLDDDKREMGIQVIPERCDGFGQTETEVQKTTIDVQV